MRLFRITKENGTRLAAERRLTVRDAGGHNLPANRSALPIEPTTPLATVLVLMPLPCNGAGVSYTCTSIARAIDPSALNTTIFTPYGHEGIRASSRLVETLPWMLRLLPFRFVVSSSATHNEHSFFQEARRIAKSEKAIAYIWPNASLALLHQLRDIGIPIVREMVNCHRAAAKAILDAEYRRLGLPAWHGISATSAEAEREALEYCDYVFCSNPLSRRSLIDNGVLSDKIWEVSFGWDPDRFNGEARALAPIEGATFLFVGYICVRKGAHLILQYWARSRIRGRLVLIGDIEPAIRKICAEHLNRDDVVVIPYTRALGPYYRSADVFVFPSLEEGGPQVTYEAAGCQVALITSPMGAARMALDGSTGFVVDPLDEASWIAAMRTLADDQGLRRRMGLVARQRALQFTWPEVGKARGAVLQQVAQHHPPTVPEGIRLNGITSVPGAA